jgi:hypothetical protein
MRGSLRCGVYHFLVAESDAGGESLTFLWGFHLVMIEGKHWIQRICIPRFGV